MGKKTALKGIKNKEDSVMDRLKEIESRKTEIKAQIETLTVLEEVRKLNEEVDALLIEERDLKERAKRETIARNIEEGNLETKSLNLMEEKKMEEKKYGIESKEYRSAFLKNLMGKELTVEERAVIASANVAGAIPTETQNNIFAKVVEKAPMLDEITLLNVRGNVTFVVEGARTDGVDHKEGEAITESAINLVKVELAGTEIVKLVTISETVKTMTIDAFEEWLTDMLSDSIANAVEGKIFTALEANGTQIAKELNADSIREAVGTLPAAYDKGAKFYVNKRQFFTEVLGLQDKAKHDLVTFANGKYYLLGYEVAMSDKATKLSLANAKKFIGNLPQQIEVKSAYNINNNTYSYSGVAIYDGKLAIAEAAVVITGATATE